MEQVKYEEMSNIFKALSDSNRIKIVDLLYKNGETCACNLLKNSFISIIFSSFILYIILKYCTCNKVQYLRIIYR